MTSLISFIFLAITTLEMSATRMMAFECGTTNFTHALISKGTKTDRGEWPFLTALYYIDEYKFFCGGTLISNKHVLTAAHCVNQKHIQSKLLPMDVVVLLGAYDLTSRIERGVLPRDVNEIHVHPDWRVYSEKYDADLAVLVLNEAVKFTNYIRPVCLPDDNALIDDARGSVVGWGLTENGTRPNKEFIKHAFTKVLNDSYCYTTDPHAAVISSTRTFCGRGEDGNPNNGDSGGGFYIIYGSAWVQLGIVSALRTNATGYVNANSVVVYTNVKQFKAWIFEIVTQSGGSVGDTKNVEIKINLNCRYLHSDISLKYGCFVDNLDIRSENVSVTSATGAHGSLKTDQDVELIQFRSGTMFFIPSGIGHFFNNLEELEVNPNLSTKIIRRSDLMNFQNLVYLRILKNNIDTLDFDCLTDLTNLQEFTLVNNNIKEVSETAFLTNTKLRELYMYSNKLEVLPKSLFKNNLFLEVIVLHENSLTTLDEMTFETNAKLRDVQLHSNKLQTLPRNLFKNKFLLEIVNLHNNLLTFIDEKTFETNEKLREVYLNSNKLRVLPPNLFRNNFLLEKVGLNENLLKYINESSFETNAELGEVQLHSNQLDILPRNLFENNLLLEIVNLNENSLKEIDEKSFEANVKLREVYLYSNQIEVLPRNIFKNNLLLEIVSLTYNSLKSIDEATFKANAKLRDVWLYANQLEVLPRNLFKNNSLLEIVNLLRNSLKEIDEAIFETNFKLREVDLSVNQLEVLPKNLFKNNLLLEIVHVRDNSLKVIETDFTAFKNIKEIFFYENVCIDAYYGLDDPYEYPRRYRKQYRNLMAFQNLIRVNCSSFTT